MFNNMLMGAAGESIKATSFSVDNSALFNIADTEYVEFTNGGTPSNTDIGTISFWFKRGLLGASRSNDQCVFGHGTGGSVKLQMNLSGGTGTNGDTIIVGNGHATRTSAKFRDPHAWTHIVIRVDTSQSTEADRQRIYINGEQVTAFSSASYPSQNDDIFGTDPWEIAKYTGNTVNGYDGYIAEFCYCDGQSLAPTAFGETDNNGVWRPIDPTSNTFGNNGFYLPFSNSVELGVGAAPVSSTAATVSFATSAVTSSSASSYTFSSQSLSTAATGRIIAVLVVGERATAGARTVSSLTVAGVSAALVVRQTSDNGDAHEIWEAQVASGTSGDIVVNFSGSMGSAGIGVYAVYDAQYQQHYTINSEGNDLSGTLVIPTNAIAIGGGTSTSNTAGTFVGLTENFDETLEGNRTQAGGLTSTASSSGGGTTIEFNPSTPHVDDTLVAATWFPSDGPNNLTGVNSPTQTTDTPTDNHGTWSSLISYNKGVAFSEGNMRSTTSTSSGDVGGLIGSFELPTAGKYYWEWVTNDVGTTPLLGWTDITKWSPNNTSTGKEINAAKFITGNDYNTGSGRILSSTIDGSTSLSQAAYGNFLTVSGGNPLANGTVLGCAYDADNGLAWFSYNNTWVDGNGTDSSSTVKGEIEAGTSGSQAFTTANGAVGEAGLFITASVQSVSSGDFTLRTRSDQWTGDCPSGFTALSTKNQAEAVTLTIEDGSAYHQTSLWEGNITARKITQSGFNSTFQPDWIWGKNRDNSGYSFRYFDSVRGVEKVLQTGGSSYTDAEATDSNGVTDFEADGFDIGNGVHLNGDGESIVAWQWAAGGEPTTDNTAGAGATPTAGSVKIDGSNLGSALGGTIPVTRLSANRKSGFSIGTYTGSGSNGTIATGLTTKPDMLIIKKRGDDGGNNWVTYHSSLANQGTGYVDLGTNAAEGTLANMFNSVAPGSSDATLFNVGTNTSTNDTGGSDTYVFYCFHEVPGYSKFGVFAGNNNANGPYIPLGFSASWIMIKRINISTASWVIYDNARDPINPANIMLLPDSTAGDNTGNKMDWLSNGVKIRGTSTAYNSTTSNNYIYMAFAENPFAGTTPATAR